MECGADGRRGAPAFGQCARAKVISSARLAGGISPWTAANRRGCVGRAAEAGRSFAGARPPPAAVVQIHLLPYFLQFLAESRQRLIDGRGGGGGRGGRLRTVGDDFDHRLLPEAGQAGRLERTDIEHDASGPRRARIWATASSGEAAMKGMGWLAVPFISIQTGDRAGALDFDARGHFRVSQHGQVGKGGFKKAPESRRICGAHNTPAAGPR